ncbi:MAG TPA: hypothetical protein VK590_14780, partial [Saprospiraceae bacterium]|nr:hypothetical protein [Saprospiraceae bacterium]
MEYRDSIKIPKWQFVSCISGTILFSFVFWLFVKTGTMTDYLPFYWMSASAYLLLYAIFNSLISLTSDNSAYWGSSIVMFILLAVLAGGVAYGFSGISIYDAGSYSFIYIVISFGYLVFISIMGFVKKIVSFAQKEVWLQPRLRRKK